MRNAAPIPASSATLLGLAYFTGLLGWVWDWLEHGAVLHIGPGVAAAHALMGTGAVLAVLFLVPREGSLPRLWAYAWLSGAIALMLLLPPAGYVVLAALAVTVAVVWTRRRSVAASVAAVGILVFFAGGVVDVIWHLAAQEGGDSESNILLLPGHQLQLIGWLVGLAGALLVLLGHARTRMSGTSTGRSGSSSGTSG